MCRQDNMFFLSVSNNDAKYLADSNNQRLVLIIHAAASVNQCGLALCSHMQYVDIS